MPKLPDPQDAASQHDILVGKTVDRFLIRERLAGGGMGEVYRAEDTVLKRTVALKRVATRLGGDPSYREGFLEEARHASGFTDPHIAGIYDVLEADGELFLVMEYVEGKTLRQRFYEPFTLDQFLDIANQCGLGLKAAHDRGILHCDLKPENIMVTACGAVKILDFGLARKLPRKDRASPSNHEGSAAGGSPGYAAPEVLLEGAAVALALADERSDIFSLGVVFYESLAGRHPFQAGSSIGTTDRILSAAPPPIRTFFPAVPEKLEAVVHKMLAKEPDQRYANATELLADLEGAAGSSPDLNTSLVGPASSPEINRSNEAKGRYALTGGLVLGLGLGAGAVILVVSLLIVILPGVRGWFGRVVVVIVNVVNGRGNGNYTGGTGKHIAVLGFAAQDAAPRTQAFGNGLTETLTTRLTQLTGRYPLQVVPPSEMRRQHISTAEQARQNLGANIVIEGSMERGGDKVRILYHLVDTHTLRQTQGGVITADMSDPFSVEDRVVESVLAALNLELESNDRTALASTRGTMEPGAYDFYLRGRGYLQNYEKIENISHAIEEFNHALQRDPNNSLAYAGLGESYWQRYLQTRETDLIAEAEKACLKSVALGPSLSNGHICLGGVYNKTARDELSRQEFQRALELDSTNDDAYRGLAYAYEHLGHLDQAEATYRQAIRMRPYYWAGYSWLGYFYLSQSRYEEATKMFEQVVALAPDSFRGYSNLGAVYMVRGMDAEATPYLERSVQIRSSPAALSNLGIAYFDRRRFAEAAQAYEKAVSLAPRRSEYLGNLAEAYSFVPGQSARAEEIYQRAIARSQEDLKINPRDALLLALSGLYAAALGEKDQAENYTQKALAINGNNPDVLFQTACTFAQMKDDLRTLNQLEKAISLGLPAARITSNPRFDKFGGDARFQSLLQANKHGGK